MLLVQSAWEDALILTSLFPERSYLPDWPPPRELVEACISLSGMGASLVLC